MKVIYHADFLPSYTMDPAAAEGRIDAVLKEIEGRVTFIDAAPATERDIEAVHTRSHIGMVRRDGVYEIAALAAGGAIQAAEIGLSEPCFALIRPPGHHASANSYWGFCYFNNMAIALEKLRRDGKIKTALVLDFDLHFGDGTMNILGGRGYVELYNPGASNRKEYVNSVEKWLSSKSADIIGVCAGFDNHVNDWGGLLSTQDYQDMGRMVREASVRNGGGCFGILEGGYNHGVLGRNVRAFIEGMGGGGIRGMRLRRRERAEALTPSQGA
jgi:acetoin utilization deacetylase AcuC-like enzyme